MQIVECSELDWSAWIRDGDAVMWGQAAAEPLALTRELLRQRQRIGHLEVFIGATWSDCTEVAGAGELRLRSYCGAAGNRLLAKAGVLDILPCHYSQLPALIRSGALRVDVLMLQLAPPDANGRYSLSLAHDYLIAALEAARVVIAEVNEEAPWTFGSHYLTAEDIDVMVRTSREPLRPPAARCGEIEQAVARRAAALIEDGSTLQLGLGAVPAAVLSELHGRRDLGIHTGALVDPVASLAQAGVITNARKSVDPGVSVAGVLMGGRALCDYVHRNPRVEFRSVDYTHSAGTLARIERFVAVNSAIEVDLTGQINAEVAGGDYVGAVGGAGDFLRGALFSQGGLPIVALPSVAGTGDKRVSRIVARLSGPVSTPRSDSAIIVTEHGVADLRGLSLAERQARLLAVADPQFRESLERAVRQGAGSGAACCLLKTDI